MTKTATAHDRIADAALAALTAIRPSNDAVGAAVAAAALLAGRAAQEISDRDRVIRRFCAGRRADCATLDDWACRAD